MRVQRHRTDFLSCCADDESDGLSEKHCQFLEKSKRQGERARESEEEERQRASAKRNLKHIKKARQRDDRMQGNVNSQEQAALKAHNKSHEQKKQSSLTAFFGLHKTDEDSGNTKMCEGEEPIGDPHCRRLKDDSDDELPDLEPRDDEGDEPVDDFPGGCLKDNSNDELSDLVPSDDVLFPFAQDASADSKAHSVTKAATSATDGQTYETAAKEVREREQGDQDKAGSTICSHRLPHIEIVDLCDSPPPKRHFCVSTSKEGGKADRREALDIARKNTKHLLQMMKKPREISEVSEKHHLQGAVKWAFLQRGAPTEQQSAAAGDNRQTMSA